MSIMRIACCQLDTRWHNWPANRDKLTAWANDLPKGTDLLILPETFASGFSNNTKLAAQDMQGEAVKWMFEISATYDLVCMGSLVISDDGKHYNRFIATFPDGSIAYYDKRHLFSFAGEDKYYTAGDHKLIFEWQNWTICPLVCYDLRFPVWSRNVEGYDLLVYVANWPAAREMAWFALLKARAIENQACVIGVNRTGVDGNGIQYNGGTVIFDAAGNEVQKAVHGVECVVNVTLDRADIHKFRAKYNFLPDRDSFFFDP